MKGLADAARKLDLRLIEALRQCIFRINENGFGA